jgi:hypothetical protein
MSDQEKAAAPVEKISEEDRLNLELAKANRKVALANAEKALAQNESSETNYRYIVLQIFMKYGMNPGADLLHEDGTVKRGGVQEQQAAQAAQKAE